MVLRRFLFALNVVHFEESPTFQIILYQTSSLCCLMYLISVRPFETDKMNNLEVFNELNVFVASFHLVALISMEESDDVARQKQINKLTKDIGTSFIGFSCFQISINLIFLLSEFFVSFCKLFKKLKTFMNTNNVASGTAHAQQKLNQTKAKIHDIGTTQHSEWWINGIDHSGAIHIEEYDRAKPKNEEGKEMMKQELETKKDKRLQFNFQVEMHDPTKNYSFSTPTTISTSGNHVEKISSLFQIPAPSPVKSIFTNQIDYQDHFKPKPPQLLLSKAKPHPLPSSQIQGLSISQILQATSDYSGHQIHQDEFYQHDIKSAYENYSLQMIQNEIDTHWQGRKPQVPK
ncbi:hypothetical protein FGO68_gene6894 [Halteria grandinella]|uniref:Uncharacterized protein n=1 Tax=Halteria grandinella TaxID=5974 RepID=A0A8J8P4P7_HALGN|nr:hypothetical protein FGO68_gene6894 [Halteria grandinella]